MKLSATLILAAALFLAACQGGIVRYGVSYSTGYPAGYYDPYFVGPLGGPYLPPPWIPYYAPYYAPAPLWYGPPRFARPFGYWSSGVRPPFQHRRSYRHR